MRLASIQVGKPRRLGVDAHAAADAALTNAASTNGDFAGAASAWMDKPWTTGYGKLPVQGPVFLGKLNLDGDGQADARWHGGPEMAVLAYASAHYPRWREELSWPDLSYGAFAENFTVEGVDEGAACIGDIWEVGEARLQISEPRKPCRNISRFWHRESLLRLTEQTGRIGWYLRVLREGTVRAGQPIALVARPHPEWTIARAMSARKQMARDPATAARLAACPALGSDWRERLLEKKAGPG